MMVTAAPSPALSPQEQGRLIVFTQPGASGLAKDFEEEHLPAIRRLASELELPLEVLDTRNGCPREVGITPLIVYQNYRGRSIYQGRYSNLGRLRNFIRTSRFVPQGSSPLEKNKIAVWSLERARVAAPVKIVPVGGSTPDTHAHEEFVESATAAMSRGFHRFQIEEHASLGRADRLFYMDVYPWRDENDTLYLSLALFSQFHCEVPVYEESENPVSGPWQDRDRLFAEAGARLEEAVVRQLQETNRGDGFDPVKTTVPVRSWADLGLGLPDPPSKEIHVNQDIPLVRGWRLTTSPDGAPPIQFQFPAPLDRYSGTADSTSAEITLGPGLTIGNATGWVEVLTRSVTMGDGSIDTVIHSTQFLNTRAFPAARFTVDSVEGNDVSLTYGDLTQATLRGRFELRGHTEAIRLRVTLEPVVSQVDTPQLLVQGAFTIRLKEPFGIMGADGPFPENDTVVITLRLVLEPRPKP